VNESSFNLSAYLRSLFLVVYWKNKLDENTILDIKKKLLKSYL
jgi:hypothetical protein